MTSKKLGMVVLGTLVTVSLVKVGVGFAETRSETRYAPTNQQVIAEKQADLEIAMRQFGKSHPRVVYLQTQFNALVAVRDQEDELLTEDFDRVTLLQTIRQLQSQVKELQTRIDRLEKPKSTGIFDDQA